MHRSQTGLASSHLTLRILKMGCWLAHSPLAWAEQIPASEAPGLSFGPSGLSYGRLGEGSIDHHQLTSRGLLVIGHWVRASFSVVGFLGYGDLTQNYRSWWDIIPDGQLDLDWKKELPVSQVHRPDGRLSSRYFETRRLVRGSARAESPVYSIGGQEENIQYWNWGRKKCYRVCDGFYPWDVPPQIQYRGAGLGVCLRFWA